MTNVRRLLRLAVCLTAVTTARVFAQDVLTLPVTSASAGTNASVPLYLQDLSSTPLGTDMGIGKPIQALSFRVTVSPVSAITAASFTRTGPLAGLTPLYERTVTGSGSIAWIGSFSETASPIPLTPNPASPGDRIGTLSLTLAAGLPDSIVTVAFDPVTTLLSNQAATLTETTFNHGLTLTNGSIRIGGAATTITLSATPNPSTAGQTVTLNAAVSSGTAGTITGSVAFYDGSQAIGFSTLQSGHAILTTSALAPATRSLTAIYEGDASYRQSTSAIVSQSVTQPLAPPTNVIATGTGSSTATITWSAVTDATSYDVRRRVNGGSWVSAGAPTATVFNETGLVPDRAYVYAVRAVSAGGSSTDSAIDIATTFVFTDDPLVAGTTPVKAVHLTDLRAAANALRVAAGLPPIAFTDPTPATVRKIHLDELRYAIQTSRATLTLPASTLADPTVTAGTTPVRAVHFQQLRDALK